VFKVLIGAASFVAGAVAAVAGFGIGSILTPLVALDAGTRVAVAAVSVPHLAGTFVRFWMLRRNVDRRVLVNFGILSAAGGLAGALLHSVAPSPVLTRVFAALLIFAGLTAVSGYAGKIRFGRGAAWVAGGASGMLGGLVGNQGGIRSAALLGFGLERQAFVGTATAIGLIVDAARIPVYLGTAGGEMAAIWKLIAIGTAGVLAGTFFGTRVLRRIREKAFQRFIGVVLLVLGVVMVWRGFEGA
jgi:uncharacterized protein